MNVKEIEKKIAKMIKKETGAIVEVAITTKYVIICTEDCGKVQAIKMLMARTNHDLCSETYYEASEDMPEAITMRFELRGSE